MIRIAVLAIFAVATLQAHEIGTTRVAISFPNAKTYDVEIVTDATARAEKLQLPATTNYSQLQTLLANSDQQLRQRIKLIFDQTEVHPAMTFKVEAPADALAASAATIHLSGEIPTGAKSLTWNYSWTFASYAITLHGPSAPLTEWLEGGATSRAFALNSLTAPANRLQTALLYLKLGFTHIVPLGLDHMLFVLGIYLLSGRARSVFLQVSAFTLAHSITLGLSMYGLLNVSPKIVEPMIAISIAYVAIENLLLSELRPWRVALVFAFGLLHGMGFAGALQEVGLPRSEFLTALLTFNLGVEAGQLSVIGAAFLLVGWYGAERTWYRSRVVLPASALIACIAIYWTVVRIVA